MNKLEKLYEQALVKWGFNWLPATPPGTYLHSFDEFKRKMESDKELYNKVVKLLNQNYIGILTDEYDIDTIGYNISSDIKDMLRWKKEMDVCNDVKKCMVYEINQNKEDE